MNLFQFLKWFFKERKTSSITALVVWLILLGITVFVQITEETENIWLMYTVITTFFSSYYLLQYRAYKQMKKVEELRRQQLND